VADADLVVAVDDLVDLAARGADAGQVRGRQQLGLFEDAGDGRVRPFPRRAASAIGHRDEVGLKRRQPPDGLPQVLLHLASLRREELERDRRPLWRAMPVGQGRYLGHRSTNSASCSRAVWSSVRGAKIGQTGPPKQPTGDGKWPNSQIIYPISDHTTPILGKYNIRNINVLARRRELGRSKTTERICRLSHIEDRPPTCGRTAAPRAA